MRRFFLIDEFFCHRRIFFSSSHDLLASISHLLLEQFIDFYMINSCRFDILQFSHLLFDTLTLATRHEHRRVTRHHSTHSLTIVHRHSKRSFAIIHHYSKFSLMIAHRFSTYFSRSLIITRDFHSRSLIVSRRTRHDRSSFFDVLVTIVHCFSTHSSRSLIALRRFRYDYSSFFETFFTIVHRHSRLSFTIIEHYLRALDIN